MVIPGASRPVAELIHSQLLIVYVPDTEHDSGVKISRRWTCRWYLLSAATWCHSDSLCSHYSNVLLLSLEGSLVLVGVEYRNGSYGILSFDITTINNTNAGYLKLYLQRSSFY